MKQQQITYDKGITYVPSDVLCSDNALSECVGMTYENGEMKPIQIPSALFTSAVATDGVTPMAIPYLLYIHEFNDEKRYVGYIEQTIIGGSVVKTMVWGIRDGSTYKQKGWLNDATNYNFLRYDPSVKLTSVGKTLIFTNSEGILYHLWTKNGSSGSYYCLGGAFPRPEVEYKLGDRNDIWVHKAIQASGIYWDDNYYHINNNQQQDWNNSVIGTYESLKNNIWRKKAFVGTFCVRAALELYDGSYYHVQNPVLMVNHFSSYGIAYLSGTSNDGITLTMELFGQKLYYKFSQDYTKWSDIIKNVVLFVTREQSLFDTTSDATLGSGADSTHANEYLYYYMSGNKIYADAAQVGGDNPRLSGEGAPYIVMDSIPNSDIEENIRNGVYYKLCEIGLSGDGSFHAADENYDTHKIETLTTQTQLVTDDYYSHCDLMAGMLYSYNSRLNLAQVKRGLFEGFDFFMPFTRAIDESSETSATYTFYVDVETDSGTITVAKEITTCYNKQGIYFYYPDPRAKHVVIKKDNDYILDSDLKEHPTLNGAYYFAGVSPSMNEPDEITSDPPNPQVSSSWLETLPNYILTSEVNNPFVFRPEGYYKVGTGKIKGMSTITQALSEGQFGQFPLLVFSESGIWALTVGSTGYYTSIHPISREVCSNAKSITQTDGAVYFVSKKGLMVVIGSSVKCVSEQLDGRMYDNSAPLNFVISPDFKAFLEDCMIAYDYRESQLILINTSSNFNDAFQWIYNMKSGTFSKAKLLGTNKITNIVNAYPDNLLQGEIPVTVNNEPGVSYNVYSLLGKPDQNSDTYDSYSGTILTRPMKLENGLALKTIMDLENIRFFHQDTYTETEGQTTVTKNCLVLRIYGSNNCKNWLEVPSLTGVPWKYYRFKFEFNKLKASDRFAGTVLVTQERRTNQLR